MLLRGAAPFDRFIQNLRRHVGYDDDRRRAEPLFTATAR